MSDKSHIWAAPNRLSPSFSATRDGSSGALDTPEQALAFAISVMSPWVIDREVYIPFLDENAMKVLKFFKQVSQRVGSDGVDRTVGYEVDDLSSQEWQDLFLASGLAAKWIRQYLSVNIETGYLMPEGARAFAASLTNGLKDPPAPPVKKSKFHRDTLLSSVAKRVSEAFGTHLGATKTKLSAKPPPFCGCVIAAAALSALGVPVSYSRADDICRNPDISTDKLDEFACLRPRLLRQYNALTPKVRVETLAILGKDNEDEYRHALAELGLTFSDSYIEQ